MSIVRVEKNANYSITSNFHLRERKMSLKAKGLMSLMLSLPNDWDYSIEGLVSICTEKETAIKSTLKELKQFGYLKMIKKMPNETKSGRIEYEYIVYEEKQDTKKQGVENLPIEILGVENHTQLNTNQLNTNKENTNYIYNNIVEYLNEKADTHYKATTPKTKKMIDARIKEKFTLEDFKVVIDKKVGEWKGDPIMEKYLRPETLFGTKFESYLNQKTGEYNGRRIREDGSEYANIK